MSSPPPPTATPPGDAPDSSATLERLRPALAERYAIERELGRGGMATVFLARDLKHDREVALKVLHSDLAASVGAERFEREIRLAAKLQHPHIIGLHDSGAAGDLLYYVMPFIKGESLRDRITREGMLPVEDAIQITLEVCDALGYAHAQGIVHRDIKPENVMLAGGHALVADFGIARAVGDSTSGKPKLTQTGMSMGTPYYMAPEQASGETAGPTADLYSLGCVLYEMLSGEPPFTGKNAMQVMARHAMEQVPSIRIVRNVVPEEVENVIFLAMGKVPADRPQTAAQFAEMMGIPLGSTASMRIMRKHRPKRKDIRALAVLPLANLSHDPEQQFFADGMTEQLITDLSKICALKVISRTSSMRYKGTSKSLPEIAAELKVDVVVEGSVLRSGNRVRISAQLIQATTDAHLWAESYERDAQDVLPLQADVAREIARQIKVVVTPEEARRLATARRVNPEAHEAYLKGCFHWFKLTPQDLQRSMQYFQLALQKDPDYAMAHVGMARYWGGLAATSVSPREVWPKAKAEALKAIELDDSVGEAHDVLAWVLTWFEYDWSAAEREFRRGLELNPNHGHGHLFYALFLNSMRRWDEAKSHTERALELDPHNAFFWWIHGFELLCRREYDEAIAEIQKSLVIDPNFVTAHWGLWGAFHAKQLYDQALPELRSGFALFARGVPEVAEALDDGYVEAGYPEALRRAAEKLAESSEKMYLDPYFIAEVFAGAGERGRALDFLEKAYRDRIVQMVYLGVHPAWDPFREGPRFQNLLRKMNFPQ